MKFLLIDIGNVLADFDDRDLLSAVVRSTSRPAQYATAREPELDDLVEKGRISDEEYVIRLNESKGLTWSIDQLTDIWSQVFTLNQEGWRLYQEAALAGVPVYMLSNIAQFHINAIKRNWPTFFDDAHGLFLSYQIGVRKPHPGIYQHVLDELGVEGEECFFIDDLPPNIEAARAAGMHAHQFIPGSQASIREAARRFFGWKV